MKELRCPKCNAKLLEFDNGLDYLGSFELEIKCKCKEYVNLYVTDEVETITIVTK